VLALQPTAFCSAGSAANKIAGERGTIWCEAMLRN
jgi:hypothetical protein